MRPSPGECAVFKSGEGASRSPPTPPLGERSRSAIKKVGGKSAQMRESEKGRRDEEDDSLLGEVLAERRPKKAEEWAKQKTMKWLP